MDPLQNARAGPLEPTHPPTPTGSFSHPENRAAQQQAVLRGSLAGRSPPIGSLDMNDVGYLVLLFLAALAPLGLVLAKASAVGGKDRDRGGGAGDMPH